MNSLSEKLIHCPYCGEQISILLDPGDLEQSYVEDCQVCCRPIVMTLFEDSFGELSVDIRDENCG